MVGLLILYGCCTIQLWKKVGGSNRCPGKIQWKICGNTLVEESDFYWLNQDRWKMYKNISGNYYARRVEHKGGKIIHVEMAREIIGLSRSPGWGGDQADHIDHDTLNNCKENLRKATRSQSAVNRRKCGSGQLPKGVYKNGVGYYADIKDNGLRAIFTTLRNKDEAWFMRKEAEKYVQGDYSCSEDIPEDKMPTPERQERLRKMVIDKLSENGFSI